MWTRLVVFVGLALIVASSAVGARSTRIVGSIASVTPSSLDVVTKSEGTKSVHLDERTQYMKWITQKPWQQSQQADFTSLSVGRCVEVDLRSADGSDAKLVRVSTEPTGSIGDPCRFRPSAPAR
jgi:hypothetical protein